MDHGPNYLEQGLVLAVVLAGCLGCLRQAKRLLEHT